MSTIDLSEVLKTKLVGKSIKHSVGATLFDGQIKQHCPCPPDNCCDILYEFGYGDLGFDQINVTYGSPQRSSLPVDTVRRRWILENHTDRPDKKNLTLQLIFTESIAAGVSRTVTEGRTVVFSANAQFDFKVVGKFSLGYTETISLSVQSSTSRTETRTKTQTETYDIGYDVPARTAAVIDLTKELVSYRTPFTATVVIDGYFAIISTVIKKGFTRRQDMDKGWGKLSNYLSESERTIVIEGYVGETAGETTRRSVKYEPLHSQVDANDDALASLIELPLPRWLTQGFCGTESASASSTTAFIRLLNVNAFQDGQFDVTFGVWTHNCQHSSCAGFDATLMIEQDGVVQPKLYSFGGWSIAEGDGSYFTITRSGIEYGIVVDVVNIESPTIACDD